MPKVTFNRQALVLDSLPVRRAGTDTGEAVRAERRLTIVLILSTYTGTRGQIGVTCAGSSPR